MPKQDLRAGELEKAQEIADVIFPAGDQSARVVEPGKEAFNLPATTVPAQGPAVLGAASAPRSDESFGPCRSNGPTESAAGYRPEGLPALRKADRVTT